ncbi:MAG: flagellar biosynthetic protein FliR [Rickettsiales bacterium]|nr:flagellar biosynthetic protein FliR [Rickettsiales bacterium]
MEFSQITVAAVYSYMLIFTRVGACIMVMPGVGERYVPVRIRLLIALVITVIVQPLAAPYLPEAIPTAPLGLFLIVLNEVVVGVFFGLVARLLISTSHMAGMIIGYQSGLAAAMMFDPNTGAQGSTIGAFLTLISTVLFLLTDLHHLLLIAVVDSYSLFIPANDIMSDDMAHFITHVISESFLIAMKISAPYIVIGLLLYLGAGIMSRLMPNMQIFFVLMPVPIMIGFVILAITLPVVMLWYMEHIREMIGLFIK